MNDDGEIATSKKRVEAKIQNFKEIYGGNLVRIKQPAAIAVLKRYAWTAQRARAACVAVAQLMDRGLFVYSPIAHCENIAPHRNLRPREENSGFVNWQDFDKLMISRCQCVWVLGLDGWMESVGVRAEIKYAWDLGIKVELLRWPDLVVIASTENNSLKLEKL